MLLHLPPSPLLACRAMVGSSAARTLRRCKGVLRAHGAPALQEAHGSWPVGWAEAPQHPPRGCAQAEQPRRPRLRHVTSGVLLRRVMPARVPVALPGSSAAGGVGIEA